MKSEFSRHKLIITQENCRHLFERNLSKCYSHQGHSNTALINKEVYAHASTAKYQHASKPGSCVSDLILLNIVICNS
jgi:hypothetical protein